MNNFYGSSSKTTQDSKQEAQSIAFAPVVFQVSKVMRDLGILKIIYECGEEGIDFEKILSQLTISKYGLSVLLDASESIGLVRKENDRYILTKTGYFIETDIMTKIHMNFVHDVCYQGLFYMDEAIKEKKAAGLKVFGDKWDTVYEALSELPGHVKKSWFDFDHYFSDGAFPRVLPIVFKNKPQKLLDVGGNTGKWAIKCAQYSEDVNVTILDHPGQLEMAKKNAVENGVGDRISGHPIDLLDHTKPFPKGHDAIWMSQFLDCFSEEDVLELLKRAHDAMDENSRLYIMETYTDRQRFDIGKYCLDMTSLYFTCIANGNSRMYRSYDFTALVDKAGLVIEEDIDHIKFSHTLFICKRK